MKKKLLSLFLFINILTTQTFSQEGIPYLSNYFIDQQTQSIIWAIEQSDDGQMFFANREGILSFDGSSWQFITVPSLPLTIKQLGEKVYVGCRNGFGEILQQKDGSFVFQELISWSDSIGDITSIVENENFICFAGENSINCIEKESYQLKNQYLFSNGNVISDLIPFNDKIYFIQAGIGLQLLDIDTIQIVNSSQEFLENELLFSTTFNAKKLLLGFDNGELYLFDGNNLAEFNIKDAEYLEASIIGGGIDISDETFVLFTLNGGALVINKNDGETQFTINFQTGLPDDEIFSIGKDNNGGLWLSHEYGLTRVDLSKPVRNFSFYPGLKGNYNDIILYNEQLYVSTSDGVYYLTEIKDYS